MRAERHEIVERAHPRLQVVCECFVHQRHRHRPGTIRNDDEHPLPINREMRQRAGDDGDDVTVGEVTLEKAMASDHPGHAKASLTGLSTGTCYNSALLGSWELGGI